VGRDAAHVIEQLTARNAVLTSADALKS